MEVGEEGLTTGLDLEEIGVDSSRPFPIVRAAGSTPAERYLQRLCEKNFLSLWSYARPYRDQGGRKEICDLVVVMGDDVIIF